MHGSPILVGPARSDESSVSRCSALHRETRVHVERELASAESAHVMNVEREFRRQNLPHRREISRCSAEQRETKPLLKARKLRKTRMFARFGEQSENGSVTTVESPL